MNLLFNNNIIFIHGLWLPLCVRINYGEHVFIQPRSYSISVLVFFLFCFFENGSDLNPHLNLQNSDP